MKNKINYEDLLKLGFQREDIYDSVFYKQNGYTCFYFVCKVTKNMYFDWDVETKQVSLNFVKKEDILASIANCAIEDIESILRLFKRIP